MSFISEIFFSQTDKYRAYARAEYQKIFYSVVVRGSSLQNTQHAFWLCLVNQRSNSFSGRFEEGSGARSSEIQSLEYFKQGTSQWIVPLANHTCPINF
jgi:hypothetical protein